METMELITKIALFIGACILALFIGACSKKPKPEPEPGPEPEPTWETFYPVRCYKPFSIIYDSRWKKRDLDSAEWKEYENKILEFMKIQGREGIFDALTLARVLVIKIGGVYFFVWTSDMTVWIVLDYWATPYQFVIIKLGKGDCEDFAAVHCAFLFLMCHYWLVWWIEIYWKKKGNLLGHAITIFKATPESGWRAFSNQQYLGLSFGTDMTKGYESVGDIVSKFCPKDADHELIKVVARHPIEGYLLWIVDQNHGYEEMWLTLAEMKSRLKRK